MALIGSSLRIVECGNFTIPSGFDSANLLLSKFDTANCQVAKAGIIITSLCSTFGIFLMRQFMESIPNDLIDAGRIDGAGEWWIFSRVVLPLAKAPLSALAVFTFLGSWDSFLWPLVVLTSPENRTLPLVLAGLRSLYWSRYEMFAAGSMLTVLPVMIIYGLASKQFVRGIAMTGIKA